MFSYCNGQGCRRRHVIPCYTADGQREERKAGGEMKKKHMKKIIESQFFWESGLFSRTCRSFFMLANSVSYVQMNNHDTGSSIRNE